MEKDKKKKEEKPNSSEFAMYAGIVKRESFPFPPLRG